MVPRFEFLPGFANKAESNATVKLGPSQKSTGPKMELINGRSEMRSISAFEKS